MLIEGDGADEGDVDMAVRREKSDQRQQAAQDQGDPTLDVEQKNLPTPSPRHSVYDTPVLVGKEGKAPSQPPAHPAGTKTWATSSEKLPNPQSPHDLQPEQHLSRFHKAAGLHP